MNLNQGICALLLLSSAAVPAASIHSTSESDAAATNYPRFIPRPEVQTEQRGNLQLTSVLAEGAAPYPGTLFTVMREEPDAYGKTRRTVLAASGPQAHGQFDLSPGRYLVQARNGAVTVELRVEIPEQGSLRQLVVLNAGELHLSSSLDTAGQPAERTWFKILRPDLDSYGRPIRIQVAGNGYDQSASFVLPAGEYIAEASYGDAHTELPIRVEPAGVHHQDLVLNAGRLELFTTLVSDGERIGGTRISVHRRRTGNDGADEWIELTRAEHTDAITFILPQGDYLARASLDQATVEIPVQVEAAETQTFELPLNAGEIHLKTVLQGYREPLLDAGFRLQPKPGPDETEVESVRLHGEQGEARCIVPAGRYLVGLQAGAAATEIEIEVEAGTSQSHIIGLEAGRVTLRMASDEKTAPYPDSWFAVYRAEQDANGRELRRRVFNSGYHTEAAVILPAGRYFAMARNHRFRGERVFTLDAGEVTDVTIPGVPRAVDNRTATVQRVR